MRTPIYAAIVLAFFGCQGDAKSPPREARATNSASAVTHWACRASYESTGGFQDFRISCSRGVL
jgi:hypothetical protein